MPRSTPSVSSANAINAPRLQEDAKPCVSDLVAKLVDKPFDNLEWFANLCKLYGSHPMDNLKYAIPKTNDDSFSRIALDFCQEHADTAQASTEDKDKLWQVFLNTCSARFAPRCDWSRHMDIAHLEIRTDEDHAAYSERARSLLANVNPELHVVCTYLAGFHDTRLQLFISDKQPKTLHDAIILVDRYFSIVRSKRRHDTASSDLKRSKRFPPQQPPRSHQPRMRNRRPKQHQLRKLPPCSRCGRTNHVVSDCHARRHVNGKQLDGPTATNTVRVNPTQAGAELHDASHVPPPPPPRPLPRVDPAESVSQLTESVKQIGIVEDMQFDEEGRPVTVVSVNACTRNSSLISTNVLFCNKRLRALVDTGAERSLCKLSNFSETRPGAKLTLALADGSTSTTDRYATGKIEWCGHVTSMCLPAVKDLSVDLLLGMDWLQRAQPVFDFNSGTISRKCKSSQVDVHSLCTKYAPVFLDLTCMPPSRGELDVDIPLVTNAMPPKSRCYRLSSHEFTTMQETVKDLLDKGWIQPSTSSWVSPVLFVVKKDKNLRMCVDYRALNALTIPNRYPLPLLSELITKASGHSLFTSLDLKSAYHQVRLKPKARELTAFFAPGMGQFEYTVLPFGLANAPAQYQRIMDHILKNLPSENVSCYLDDILIHSSNGIDNHLQIVEDVLKTLKQSHLHLNKAKCDFVTNSVEWLGHTLSEEGHRPIEKQLDPVLHWPLPKTAHDLRQFLGAANYYKKYIRNYSDYVQPLFRHTSGTKKNSKKRLSNWTQDDSRIFNNLKATMAKLPTLCPTLDLDPTEPLDLFTDSSDKAVGAVLQHKGRPIEFYSSTLSVHERNWPIRQKELYAVIKALQHWRYLCIGRPITVYTDHKSLERVLAQNKIQEARIQRWSLFLSDFNVTFKYIPGDKNVVADALSRTCMVRELLEDETVNIRWSDYLKDPFWEKIIHDLASFPQYKRVGDLLYHKNRICVPSSSHRSVMAMAHDGLSSGHQGVSKSQARAAREFYWPGMHSAIREYVDTCHTCATAKSGRRLKVPTQALPVAPYPWHTVTMDLMVGLPTTSQGHDAIYVFVDKYSKMVHLAPTSSTVDAQGCISLFIQHVYKLHGLPEVLISDRDPRFTAALFRKVMHKFSVQMKMSTAAHAQTDGQTERVNRVVGNMLRSYAKSNQSAWVDYLPTIEFAINSSPAASTKMAPFEVCNGRIPRQIGLPARLSGQSPVLPDELMDRLAKIQHEASSNLQQHFDKASSSEHIEPPFREGDEVYVSTHLLRNEDAKYRSNKLTPPYDGPFKIKNVLGPAHYRVDFSPLKVRIHDVINIKFLKRTKGTRSVHRPGPLQGFSDDVYAMERILRHRKHRGRLEYLVKWLGYPEYEATYVQAKDMIGSRCKRLLAEYQLQTAKADAAKERSLKRRSQKSNARHIRSKTSKR